MHVVVQYKHQHNNNDNMDETEIDCILSSNSTVNKHYTGTIYCPDTLPTKLQKGKFYLTNTKNSDHNFHDEPGHWCSILYYSDDLLFFCDGFGTFPPIQFWMTLLETKSRELTFQPFQLQDYDKTTCGMHAIVYCTLFSYNLKPLEILNYVYNINEKDSGYDRSAQLFIEQFYGEKRGLYFEP